VVPQQGRASTSNAGWRTVLGEAVEEEMTDILVRPDLVSKCTVSERTSITSEKLSDQFNIRIRKTMFE
jgi:hypothetical protein